MQPDHELLRQYSRDGSEGAFAELVQRHVNLVYSAALRQAGGDTHLAHDVAQSVFTDLARKAASLCRRKSLSGWLYTSAYFAANKMVRTEMRRRQREEQFMREPSHDHPPEANWEKLRPLLDAAMHSLKESDREAILLRYFENRPYAEVGAKFGLNENAARLRVERALEKLRAILAKRAITTTAGLATAISANAIQAAPAGAIATLTTASLAVTATSTTTLLKIMTAAKLKIGLSALAIVGAATVFIVQHNSAKAANAENDQLHQQIKKLQDDAATFSNRLATASDAKSLSQDQFAELLKLRGEVSTLHSQAAEAAKIIALNAAKSQTEPDTNNPVTQENKLRKRTMDAARNLATATVWRYADRHNGRFPTNWNQVKEDYETAARLGLAPGTVVPDTEAEFAWATNEYEFTYQGSTKDLLALTNGYDMIVVREKQPWQRADGKWMKSYGMADGAGRLIVEPPEGFAAWESQRMAPPPTNQ